MNRHIVLVGATASGKSELGIDLALRFDPQPQIISLDSMQVYKGMTIGTGAIDDDHQRKVKHHMISTVAPTSQYSVKQFQSAVYDLIENNPSQKYIFVGGTGLYTHAVVDNFQFAPTHPDARNAIIEKYQLDEKNPDTEKVELAYELLCELDPSAASKIDPMNVRRIIRALEAIEISNMKFSESGSGVQNFGEPAIDVRIFGLRYSRELLRERIAQRIDTMFASGWVDEVKSLLPIWEDMTSPARNAIGYEQIYDWITNGEKISDLDDLKQRIINKTAQFSRRQRKWFERDPRITWIECDHLSRDELNDRIFDLTNDATI